MRNSLLNRELSQIRQKAYLVPRGQSRNTPKGVFGNQRVKDHYSHPDNHSRQTMDFPGFNSFTKQQYFKEYSQTIYLTTESH